MGKTENLKPFVPGHDPKRNYKGRPRKFVTTLGVEGYTLSQVNDAIQILLAMSEDELKKVDKDKDATILERTVAGALLKDMRGSHLDSISLLMDRVFGKPKTDIGIDVTGKIDHFHHVPLEVDRNLMMQIVLGKVAARSGLDVGRMTALLSDSYYSPTIDAEATVIEDKPLPSDLSYTLEEMERGAKEAKKQQDETVEDTLKRQLMEKMDAIRGQRKIVEPRKPSMKELILRKGEKG